MILTIGIIWSAASFCAWVFYMERLTRFLGGEPGSRAVKLLALVGLVFSGWVALMVILAVSLGLIAHGANP